MLLDLGSGAIHSQPAMGSVSVPSCWPEDTSSSRHSYDTPSEGAFSALEARLNPEPSSCIYLKSEPNHDFYHEVCQINYYIK